MVLTAACAGNDAARAAAAITAKIKRFMLQVSNIVTSIERLERLELIGMKRACFGAAIRKNPDSKSVLTQYR
jgi:hypothetical protein